MNNKILLLTTILSFICFCGFSQISIDNPKNGYSDLLGEITKIELKNNATIIHFNKKNKNEKWFVIPRKLFLDTEINNTRFFVLKTENIELGEKILLKDNEEINYVIYFQPIDELTKIIRIWYEDDFQETYKGPAETGGALTSEIEIQTNKTLKKSEKAFSKNSFEDALVKSEKENKNMIVYFTAGWCGPCRWMDKNIFSDEEVNTFIKSNYIALKIDVDSYQGEKLRKIYTGDGIPHFFIINSKGDILKEKVGSMKKTEFLDFIMINSTPTKEIFGSKNKTEFTSSVITDSITNKGIVITNIKSEFTGDIIIDYTTPMESTIESNKSEDIKEKGIGLRLGLVNNNISNYFNSESRTGMTVDLFYSIEYNRRYLIRSGIGFASKGIDGLTINYLKIPIEFGYSIYKGSILQLPGAVRLLGAPYYAIRLNKNGLGISNNDYGVRFGLAPVIGDFNQLEFEIYYELGMKDLFNNINGQQKNRSIGLSLSLTL